MRPMHWIKLYGPLFISLMAIMLALLAFCRSPTTNDQEAKEFVKKILSCVRSCIIYNNNIQEKDEIHDLLNTVENDSFVLEQGCDDLRVKYVSSQGCIEHTLACFQALGELNELVGVIHTPTPATPLCVRPDASVEGVLDPSIRYNLSKLLTVRSRAQIIREYLMKGAKLYVVYPEGGLEKRTPEQQKIYKEELERFMGNLFDWALNTNQISDDMIGAIYLFRNTKDQLFAFSIKARQANDIQPCAEWGIWFGSMKEPVITDRVNLVFDYLADKGGPDVRKDVIF